MNFTQIQKFVLLFNSAPVDRDVTNETDEEESVEQEQDLPTVSTDEDETENYFQEDPFSGISMSINREMTNTKWTEMQKTLKKELLRDYTSLSRNHLLAGGGSGSSSTRRLARPGNVVVPSIQNQETETPVCDSRAKIIFPRAATNTQDELR